MTDTDAFLLEFYNIIEKIDSNDYMKLDIIENIKNVCTLFKKHGLCECQSTEGKEDE